jgi:hypothetical protein
VWTFVVRAKNRDVSDLAFQGSASSTSLRLDDHRDLPTTFPSEDGIAIQPTSLDLGFSGFTFCQVSLSVVGNIYSNRLDVNASMWTGLFCHSNWEARLSIPCTRESSTLTRAERIPGPGISCDRLGEAPCRDVRPCLDH